MEIESQDSPQPATVGRYKLAEVVVRFDLEFEKRYVMPIAVGVDFGDQAASCVAVVVDLVVEGAQEGFVSHLAVGVDGDPFNDVVD